MNVRSLLLTALLSLAAASARGQALQVYDGQGTYYVATGRRTANGDRYDKAAYTCAHRTLPFGTFVRVTNLKNDRSVIVRVNDRGPFGRGMVIDVSYAAAADLDMLRMGTVPVHLEVLDATTIAREDLEAWEKGMDPKHHMSTHERYKDQFRLAPPDTVPPPHVLPRP